MPRTATSPRPTARRACATALGAALVGTGVEADADVLPDWDIEGGYFRSFGDFCDAGGIGIVVLDEVRVG